MIWFKIRLTGQRRGRRSSHGITTRLLHICPHIEHILHLSRFNPSTRDNSFFNRNSLNGAFHIGFGCSLKIGIDCRNNFDWWSHRESCVLITYPIRLFLSASSDLFPIPTFAPSSVSTGPRVAPQHHGRRHPLGSVAGPAERVETGCR